MAPGALCLRPMFLPSLRLRSSALVSLALLAALSAACTHRPSATTGRGGAAARKNTPGAPNERNAPPISSSAVAPPPAVASSPAVTVTFPTDDSVTISASLRVGRPGSTPIVLVHQLGSARAEWEPLVAKLAAAGLTTLAIDLRGHGESTAGAATNTRTYAYDSFSDADWRATPKDVQAAIAFLASREDLWPGHVVLVGSSIGGTACIAAAADDPRVVRMVVLSPGRAYHGFDAILPASRLGGREVLVFHAADEAPSAETASVLDRIVTNSTVRAVPGSAHGVAMFQDDPSQLDAVAEFIDGAQPQ